MINFSLKSAGFHKDFCELLNDTELSRGVLTEGFMITIDEPNLLRLVLDDFTKHVDNPRSLTYTNLALGSIEMTELAENIVHVQDTRISTLGPGIHKHRECPMYLCCENDNLSDQLTGVNKFVNRFALISEKSMSLMQSYLQGLRKKNDAEKKLKLFVAHEMQWIEKLEERRDPSTLFIEKVWTELHTDMQEFLDIETEKWFSLHGIPYTRAYIFYGPPGGGKSSTIKVLASVFGMPLYSLNLAMAKLDDDSLISMMQSISKRSIVAIEDIDRVFDNHTQNVTSSSVSYGTLLNLLDGTLTKQGVITILTCNAFEHLDEALKRCGRVSRILHFPNANGRMLEKMFLSFYPEKHIEAKNFASQLKPIDQIPMATVQEFFIRNRKRRAEEAVQDIDQDFFRKRRKLESSLY